MEIEGGEMEIRALRLMSWASSASSRLFPDCHSLCYQSKVCVCLCARHLARVLQRLSKGAALIVPHFSFLLGFKFALLTDASFTSLP